jgi:predicted  nucleic acid-binding Zn-ribbon protein
MSKRDNYVEKIKLQLDEMNSQFTQMETKAHAASLEARETCEREMDKLREHSRTAVAKLDEVRAASEASWHKLVSDMEKARTAFTRSFDDLKSRL